MLAQSVIKFSEFAIITSLVVFSLRPSLKLVYFLASRPWRRYRTFTIHRRRWWKKTTEDHQSPPYCAICLQDATEGEKMRRLTACSHCFHGDCIDPWLEKKSTCPMCRAQIPAAPLGNPLIALIVPPGMIEMFTKGTIGSVSSS